MEMEDPFSRVARVREGSKSKPRKQVSGRRPPSCAATVAVEAEAGILKSAIADLTARSR
jgi:hypothetical protein